MKVKFVLANEQGRYLKDDGVGTTFMDDTKNFSSRDEAEDFAATIDGEWKVREMRAWYEGD